MKMTLMIALALAFAGCATSQPSTPQRRAAVVDESEKPPFIGMTKAQAIARYGHPKKQTVTDEGEQWTYVLNFGEFIGKHMIPFFFSTEQIRTGVLIFGPDGKVKKFIWDTPTE
jgi:hypothetical protein